MSATFICALALLGSVFLYTLTTIWIDRSDGTKYFVWALSWLAYQAGCLMVLSEAPLSEHVYLTVRIACYIWIGIHFCVLISNIGNDEATDRELGR